MIQLLTGDYELVDGAGPNGLPLLSVVLHSDRERMQPYLDTIDDQIDFFDDYFGAYPLDRYGIAITDSHPGLAMETMERSLFSREDFSSGRLEHRPATASCRTSLPISGSATRCRRLAGATSGSTRAFATYGEWMWLDHVGLQSIDDSAAAGLAAREPWSTATPTAEQMFGFNSYDGGAVILHALRKTIGDDLFFDAAASVGDREQRHRHAPPDDFIDLGQRGRRAGPDRVLLDVAVRRRCCRRPFPDLVADEVLEDLAAHASRSCRCALRSGRRRSVVEAWR